MKEWDLLPKPKDNLAKRKARAEILLNDKFNEVYQIFVKHDFILPIEVLREVAIVMCRQTILDLTYGVGVRKI